MGSPYCVRRYVVDRHLGGPEGLARAREQLAALGLRLLLDFVPNHVAPDHPWAKEHPEYFIQGTDEDLQRDPSSFIALGESVIARGRDPYFPAWADVVQLNAFAPGLRAAATDTLHTIASQSDGVRCDMAMLLINQIFRRTWGERAGPEPPEEYWSKTISLVKESHPDFLFVAEAYWDLESNLQQLGFDYCYDKRLYDRLKHETAESTRLHLTASLDYQSRLVRFLENHDEPRAAATFFPEKHRAAAVATVTLPGMRLLHEGQFEGRKVHLPVFLGRRPEEPLDQGIQEFYQSLVAVLRNAPSMAGEWRLLQCEGWPDNPSNQNIVAWLWKNNASHRLVVVNLSDQRSQGRVAIPGARGEDREVRMINAPSAEVFVRSWTELLDPGLFVDLPAWGFHILDFSTAA